MLSRYVIACRPVHDLIVDYLREQQLTVDHATLRSMAHVLGKLFWRDLERHHPGIGSLRLAPEVAPLETADPGEDQQVSDRSRGHHRDQRAPYGCGRRVVHRPGVLP